VANDLMDKPASHAFRSLLHAERTVLVSIEPRNAEVRYPVSGGRVRGVDGQPRTGLGLQSLVWGLPSRCFDLSLYQRRSERRCLPL